MGDSTEKPVDSCRASTALGIKSSGFLLFSLARFFHDVHDLMLEDEQIGLAIAG